MGSKHACNVIIWPSCAIICLEHPLLLSAFCILSARSPSNPVSDTFWYRRPAYDQTGIFAAPKVLYVTKTDTRGGTTLTCCARAV